MYVIFSIKLTFASRHALKPLVISVFVAGTSAVSIPIAARSATTIFAGFLKSATFGARRRFSGGQGDGWGAD